MPVLHVHALLGVRLRRDAVIPIVRFRLVQLVQPSHQSAQHGAAFGAFVQHRVQDLHDRVVQRGIEQTWIGRGVVQLGGRQRGRVCLLYTSDAADE